MSARHPQLAPELQALAAAILDTLDPMLRKAAAPPAEGAVAGKCSQVFCPVCALAALVEGEHHPLLAMIAEHSLALVMVIRAMIEPDSSPKGAGGFGDTGDTGGGDRGAAEAGSGDESEGGYQSPFPVSSADSQSTDYQHIPVDIDE